MPSDATLTVTAELKDLFSKEFRKLGTTVQKANKQIGRTNKTVAGMGVQFKRLSHTLFSLRHVFSTVVGGIIVKSIVELGTKTENLSRAFGNLTKWGGMKTSKALDLLKEATRDTVSEFELMESANQALLLGVAKTETELYELARAGRILGKAVGRTALQGFQDLATGIGRQSRLILDNLGIIVSAEQAYSRYAGTIGKTVEALTDEERKTAFRIAALESIRRKVRSLGEDTKSYSETIGEFTAAWKDLAAELSGPVTAVIAEVAKALTSLIRTLRGYRKERDRTLGGERLRRRIEERRRATLGRPKPKKGEEEPPLSWWERLTGGEVVPEKPKPTGMTPEEKAAGFAKVIAAYRKSVEEAKRVAITVEKFQPLGKLNIEEQEKYLEHLRQIPESLQVLNEFFARTGSESQKFWGGMIDGVMKYYNAVKDTFDNAAEAVYNSLRTTQEMIGAVFFDALTDKLKNFKDYMREFLRDIARIIADFMAKQAVAELIGWAAKTILTSLKAPAGSEIPQERIETGAYQTHQYGSVVTRPQLAMVGEAGPETITPWGRTRAEGGGVGGGNHVHLHIHAMDGPSVKRVLYDEKRYIQGMVQEALGVDPGFRAAVRSV